MQMNDEAASFFEMPAESVADRLAHTELANRLAERLCTIRPGATIAVQGPWGRGKSDVLARLHRAIRSRSDVETDRPRIVASLHINPWSYGEPDLLTPLVIRLLARIPPQRRSGAEALRRAAETIIRSGLGFGLKAVSLAAPVGGGLLDAAAKPADRLLEGLFDALDKQERPDLPDADPVAAMGLRFAELIAALVEAAGGTNKDRILITVDDLDRCLPSRQVALLEAIHFLTTAESAAAASPRAMFVIALDPRLVADAMTTHFQSTAFDASGYLNKLFDARINLPAISSLDLPKVIGHLLTQRHGADKLALLFSVPAQAQPLPVATLVEQFAGGFFAPESRNMRLVLRIWERIDALIDARLAGRVEPIQVDGITGATACLLYLLMAESFPEVRTLIQHQLKEGGSHEGAAGMLRLLRQTVEPIDYQDEQKAISNLRAWHLPSSPEYAHRLAGLFRTALAHGDDYVVAMEHALRIVAM